MSERIDILLRRLEKVTGPDRKLDALLGAVLNDRPAWATTAKEEPFPHPSGRVSLGRSGAGWEAEPYTASIDAAVALLEKAMPGAPWQLCSMPKFGSVRGMPWARINAGEQAFGRTPVLALLSALLRALPSSSQVKE